MIKKKIENIGLILKPSDIEDLDNILTNLLRWLNKRNKKVFILTKEKERLTNLTNKTKSLFQYVDDKFIYHQTDLLISLGGDGTLLGVSRKVKSSLPVFSVNLGRLGFITEFSKSDFYEKLNVILLGRFTTFSKSLYRIRVKDKKGKLKESTVFFNDAVFTKNDLARMFTLNIESNGENIFNITGDGLIISSTYGSTAYSLAAGGPIVHPDVKALILTPICAHSLTHRPLVIPDNYLLKINVLDKIETVNITLDGQNCLHLKPLDIIEVTKDKTKKITLIKNEERTYFHTLKEKFVHGRREVY